MREVLFALLVLACPLMMILMMRGHGHGHRHSADANAYSRHDGSAEAHAPLTRERSTTGLRELRAEIDRMIEEREQAGRERSEDQIAGTSR